MINYKGQPLKNVHIVSKSQILSLGFITVLSIAGIVSMIMNNLISSRFYMVFAPIFTAFFGLALIFLELKPQLIHEYFGFLKSMLGRGLFNIYLATQVTFYFGCNGGDDNGGVLSWVASIILLVLGILYICLHFFAGTAYGEDLKKNIQANEPIAQ